MGAAVADGREVDAAFQQLVKLAKQAPNFPEVDMDSGAYKNVRFHSLTFPSKDNEGRRVFGDTIKMAVGMGQQHVYFAIGGDPVDTLKQVIDKRARPAAANPMELTLALTPIIRFAKAVDDAPAADAILEALAKAAGRDHFTISSQVIQNGMRYRINIEDGIIRAVATASGL